MPTKSEIESLVYLLQDPDPFVQDTVRSRLYELGERAVPLLDQQKSQTVNQQERQRIDDIIHSITIDSLEEDFVDILEGGIETYEELEDAIILLARFGNPTLRAEEIRNTFDRYASLIRDDIRYSMNERDKMRRVLDFIFDEMDFRGNVKDYHDPANSFIDQVIRRRLGLPLTLALVVIFIGRRLGLPFHGVNMPIHFMLKYEGDQQEALIDPFDGGNSVTYDQCFHFLEKNGVTPRADHLDNAMPSEILLRCIRNLIHSYDRQGDETRVKYLKRLLETLEMMFQI